MRALFGSLTLRGRSFMAAGGAAVLCGLGIPEPDLVRVGALLLILPLVSAMTARRSRYRLACSRRLDPPRVPAGRPTMVTARLENVSRLRTAVLLAEDVIPHSLGSRPRFVLDEIEPGGHREISYQVRSETRGKFTVGPLRARVADMFGLVEISRSFSGTNTLVVTPKIVPLPRAAAPGSWLGDGDGSMRTISAVGEDDAAPRAYQDGDSLHRVHWKSTARYGELMVRREEHQWRNTASVFLDTRRCAHAGSSAGRAASGGAGRAASGGGAGLAASGGGPSATFEFAVSAAASIGAHLTEEGFRARLITGAGETAPRGSFSDTLLDVLAVITPSHDLSLSRGTAALAHAGGQLIAVVGRLSAEEAGQLAASRRGNAPAMALVLDVSGWQSAEPVLDAPAAAQILAAAGWRVAVATAATPLAAAWQQLHRPADTAVLASEDVGPVRGGT
ncbi:MAG: DUF58 domain-containing protein [Streptosporangiaceae bacterium]|nr:DUF58 domain-containing protein [Streptosporangiaceae bacterium]